VLRFYRRPRLESGISRDELGVGLTAVGDSGSRSPSDDAFAWRFKSSSVTIYAVGATDKSISRRSGDGPWYLRTPVLLRLAVALTFLVYTRTITFDFVFDDHLQISLNPWLESWRQVPQYFTHQLWAFTDAHTPASFYRPLFMVWLAAVMHLTGGAPGWYHLLTMALHLIVVVEGYVLARLLVKDQLSAVFAAALFALHPTKIEAVAWISGGGEPLFAAFFFATFIAYLKWKETAGRGWIAASLGFFALALFSKEQAVVIPAVLLVYEFWRERLQPVVTRVRDSLFAVLPFALVGGAFWGIRWHVMHGIAEAQKNLSLPKTLQTQPLAWLWYLRHLVFPFDLSLFYPEMIAREFSVTRVLLPALLLIAGAALVWLAVRKKADGVLLYAWFVCTLAPPAIMVLLLQPHDRYLYLPSFAAAVGLAVLICKVVRQPGLQVLVVAVICGAFVISTFLQLRPWDNDVALMENAVAHAPDNKQARVTLAISYALQGDAERGAATLREAAQRFPNDMDTWQALAVQEYTLGHYQEAYDDFKRAVATAHPGSEGYSLYNLGLISLRLNRPEEAEQWTRKAIAVDPDSAGYHRSLATILDAEGRRAEGDAEREVVRKMKK